MNTKLRQIYYSFKRNKAVNILNIVGLTLSICVSMLIYFLADYEMGYDRHFVDSEYIYRVLQKCDDYSTNILTSTALGGELEKNYPQISKATCVFRERNGKSSTFKSNEHLGSYKAISTDDNFFDVFNFKSIYHDRCVGFTKPNSVVLSAAAANIMFGNESPIGKQLINISYRNEVFVVSDVVVLPKNTHLFFDVAVSKNHNNNSKLYWHKWGINSGVTYIKLAENAALNIHQKLQLKNYLKDRRQSDAVLLFQPLHDIHLFSDFNDPFNYHKGNIMYVRMFWFFCILLIVVGAINYIMISNALSGKRNKEIAIRKLYGAKKYQIIYYVFRDSLLFVILSQILALFIFLLVSLWMRNELTVDNIQYIYSVKYLVFLIVSTLVISGISTVYIVYYTNLGSIVKMLKGKIIHNSSNYKLSSVLYPLQLIVAFAFVVFVVNIYLQLQYVVNKDIGIDTKNIVSIDTQGMIYNLDKIKQRILLNPNIYNACATGGNPIDYHFEREVMIASDAGEKKSRMTILNVDQDFFETFGVDLLMGDLLPHDMNVDGYFDGKYIDMTPVIINETACKENGLAEPIGMSIDLGYSQGKAYIIGVVKDFNFRSMAEGVSSIAMVYNPEDFTELMVKINANTIKETLAYIKKIVDDNRQASYSFDYYFIDDTKAIIYKNDIDLMHIASLFALITTLVAFLGVLSSVIFDISEKRKSIALNKIFGASSYIVVRDYLKKMAVKVVLSLIIGGLLVLPYVLKWLNAFAYRMNFPYVMLGMVFMIAFCCILIISLPYVYYEAVKNPVVNIKYE